MNIREQREAWEEEYLSPYASLSKNSAGRDVPEEQCDIRPVYQRDRDRILHCKAFRRMKHKTQVFLAPEGDHYRTRLTHTLEVSQIARTIARALRLNEDLTEAIALGHDLGHTPFGHTGEAVLNGLCPEGFAHNVQSVRVVEVLEKNGEGLNLTKEVRDGILNHRTSCHPGTLEGAVVRLSDKIAYINHDIDDAIRARLFEESDVPAEFTDVLGHSVRDRLNTMIHDVILSSLDKPEICMSAPIETAMSGLRAWLFETVYQTEIPMVEGDKARRMLEFLYKYYYDHIDEMPQEYLDLINIRGDSVARVVCDYVSGMSDNYAIRKFEDLFVPKTWDM